MPTGFTRPAATKSSSPSTSSGRTSAESERYRSVKGGIVPHPTLQRIRRPLRSLHPRLLAALLGLATLPLPAAAAPAPGDPAAPFFSGGPDVAAFQGSVGADLKAAQDALDQLLAVKGKRTIDNTLTRYNEIMIRAENAAYESHLMESVHPDSTYRARAEDLTQRASKFLDDLSLNRPVYDALASIDSKKADAATRYFLTKTLRDFRLSAVDKDKATRHEIATLLGELTKTGQEFGRNIRTDS